MGIALGIIAGWIGAYDPKWGIGIAVVGYIAFTTLHIAEAAAMQDQIQPLSMMLGLVGVVIAGLITWKVRTHMLKKRGDL